MVWRRMPSTAIRPPSGIRNGPSRPPPCFTLVLDLGGQYQVDGWRYLPRQDGSPNGTIAGYQVYVSDDGTTWGTAVAAGTLAANTSEKTVRFTAKTGRFVRLVAVSEINGQPWTSAAELNIFGTAVVSPPASSLIPQQQMRVVSVDSQELVGENGVATNAIDGNPATFWHTQWSQQTAPLPHTLVLDLGGQYQVDGWRYLPRQDGSPNGTIAGYQVYVSPDGTTWGTAVAAGTLAATRAKRRCASRPKPAALCALLPCPRSTVNPGPVRLNSTSLGPQLSRLRRVASFPNSRCGWCLSTVRNWWGKWRGDECHRRQSGHLLAYAMVPADRPAPYPGA